MDQLEPWQTSPFRDGFLWAKDGMEGNPWESLRPRELFDMGKAAAATYATWADLKRAMLTVA